MNCKEFIYYAKSVKDICEKLGRADYMDVKLLNIIFEKLDEVDCNDGCCQQCKTHSYQFNLDSSNCTAKLSQVRTTTCTDINHTNNQNTTKTILHD